MRQRSRGRGAQGPCDRRAERRTRGDDGGRGRGRQIVENAGLAGSYVVSRLLDQSDVNLGVDARDGSYVDMFEAGITDPTLVVRTALHCAGSIGGLLVTTEAIVAEHTETPAPALDLAS